MASSRVSFTFFLLHTSELCQLVSQQHKVTSKIFGNTTVQTCNFSILEKILNERFEAMPTVFLKTRNLMPCRFVVLEPLTFKVPDVSLKGDLSGYVNSTPLIEIVHDCLVVFSLAGLRAPWTGFQNTASDGFLKHGQLFV